MALAMILTACRAQSPTVYTTPPTDGTDVSFFYDQLAPYGQWISTADYGWVWCPSNVPFGWRPYTVGHWVYADCGWTWVSDEPWGWACYHYGRWYFDSDYGWCWMPDTVWGPCWVAWNWGDDWCGWAPLPPLVGWESEPDWDHVIPHHCWNFIDRERFCDQHVERFVVPVARNVTLLQQTKNVTRIAVRNNQVVNLSLSVEQVQRAIHRPVPHVALVDARTVGELRARTPRGELRVFRPEFSSVKPQRPPPQIIRGTPTAPEQWLRQQSERHRRLQEFQVHQDAWLQQYHERELQHPPPGISPWVLGQRHQAERRAQSDEFARQDHVYEHQYQRGLDQGMHH
jgi:hypothetical protein